MDKHILAVDDCEGMREFYRVLLESSGYRVTCAVDAIQAFEVVARDTPDLIILDIGLPGMSGWEVLQALRNSVRWYDIPVIVATVRGENWSIAAAWALGCTCFVKKPVDADDLLLLVGRMVSEEFRRPQEAARLSSGETMAMAALPVLSA